MPLPQTRNGQGRFREKVLGSVLIDCASSAPSAKLPNKAAEGRFDDIAPCAACGLGCVGEQMKMKPMTCVINPSVGREKEMPLVPATTRKKVLIAGGGPGGLEAARVAALRGSE